jgi:hypothetical protein
MQHGEVHSVDGDAKCCPKEMTKAKIVPSNLFNYTLNLEGLGRGMRIALASAASIFGHMLLLDKHFIWDTLLLHTHSFGTCHLWITFGSRWLLIHIPFETCCIRTLIALVHAPFGTRSHGGTLDFWVTRILAKEVSSRTLSQKKQRDVPNTNPQGTLSWNSPLFPRWFPKSILKSKRQQ